MKRTVIFLLAVLLPACTSPKVDQAAMNFDQKEFETDLLECRGGNLLEATARTIGIGVLG